MVVHAAVPGRIRIRVRALYRNSDLKLVVERDLRQVEGVRTIEANTITATVLVMGRPDLSAADLMRCLDDLLGESTPTTELESADDVAPVGPRVETLDHFAGLARRSSRVIPESLRATGRRLLHAVRHDHLRSAEVDAIERPPARFGS
jgi:Ca2+-transporting ATPase